MCRSPKIYKRYYKSFKSPTGRANIFIFKKRRYMQSCLCRGRCCHLRLAIARIQSRQSTIPTHRSRNARRGGGRRFRPEFVCHPLDSRAKRMARNFRGMAGRIYEPRRTQYLLVCLSSVACPRYTFPPRRFLSLFAGEGGDANRGRLCIIVRRTSVYVSPQ